MKIPLTRGLYALIDKEDWPKVKDIKWHAKVDGNCIYAYNKRVGCLHRLVMGAPLDKLIDHKNLDTLDCRKNNLRLANHSENAANSRLRIDNTSGYKGVSWKKDRGLWRAYIRVNRRQISLGYYRIYKEACSAYEQAARRYFGEFGRVADV